MSSSEWQLPGYGYAWIWSGWYTEKKPDKQSWCDREKPEAPGSEGPTHGWEFTSATTVDDLYREIPDTYRCNLKCQWNGLTGIVANLN